MFRYLPWKFIVRRAARAYGMLDPTLWLARLRNFAQPSEVQEPIELLRAGLLFHARGIVNTKAIQHNLDWVWPYWVERQFDPHDVSFIPRAFSVSHINLTHRNWTAVGVPQLALYPLVDPRGLLTPVLDGWSIDCWLFDAQGARALLPSRMRDDETRQQLHVDGPLAVTTLLEHNGLVLRHTARLTIDDGHPTATLHVQAYCPDGGALVVALRPYNPEGVQFIDRVAARDAGDGWLVNDRVEVLVGRPADRLLVSDYANGDVYGLLTRPDADPPPADNPAPHIHCPAGMATAASVYRFAGPETRLSLRVPIDQEMSHHDAQQASVSAGWDASKSAAAALRLPDEHMQFLYDASVSTLILLSADDVVPGPYTYRRFWFRDACLMLNAMLSLGLSRRSRKAIDRFPSRQLRNGYFRSQEGEWDSNGQVLWILDRYETLTGERLPDAMLDAAEKAVRWIAKKRLSTASDALHAGLLPAGFSAEHLGPNDYYYWDDFWSEAGLRAAARYLHRHQRHDFAGQAEREAASLRQSIELSLQRLPASRSLGGLPASPYRRLDAGAIGSLVADYPLQLYSPAATQIMTTVEFLLRSSFHHGGFFQDMIHSGINAYLTLDIAQTLLRAGDPRYRELVETVARIASPTGQWPEAIHPLTGGGCMGDGQHGWAAAEWAMMMRNLFVREEADRLIIGSGIFPQWLQAAAKGNCDLFFGPTLTPWGSVSVQLADEALRVEADWHAEAPAIDVIVPGYEPILNVSEASSMVLQRPSDSPLSKEGATIARPCRSVAAKPHASISADNPSVVRHPRGRLD
jgi:hypothetical protein